MVCGGGAEPLGATWAATVVQSGGPGTRTPKRLRAAVFKTAALPVRSSPPEPCKIAWILLFVYPPRRCSGIMGGALDGSPEAESTLGGGSTFTLRLRKATGID
jgi:hypothetical protein